MNKLELKSHIIRNDLLEKILERLGCYNIKKHRKFYTFSTHFNTKSTSTSCRRDTLNVKVYADDIGFVSGDIFTLTMALKKIKFYNAFQYLHEILGLDFEGFNEVTDDDIEEFKTIKEEKFGIENKELKFYSEKEILKFYKKMPYLEWVKEGILPKTQEFFGIGYSADYNRVVIPHRYYKKKHGGDNYVGLFGRTLNEHYKEFNIPKYLGIVPYLKTQNLFGLFENRWYIKKAGFINVFEAEKSVLKRHSKIDRTAVALCCHEISDIHIEIILSLDVDVIIQMDSDVKGWEIRAVCEKFYGKRKVYYLKDDYGILGLKESSADKNEKIYNFLWKNKKIYSSEEHEIYLNEQAIKKYKERYYA